MPLAPCPSPRARVARSASTMAELEHSQANALRVLHVERCFGASGQPLALEGRTLLGEGVLTKVCRKSAKPRQFFLFSDLLVYGTIVKDKKKVRLVASCLAAPTHPSPSMITAPAL